MTVTLSAARDAVRLQRFLERCSDYYELHEGCSTPGDAGEYELTEIPRSATLADLHVIALENESGGLDAVVQVLANYPAAGTWWIGMLLVAPELRGRGIGPTLLREVFALAAAEGATRMKLAVSTKNPRAQKFWLTQGFRDTSETASVTARNGHAGTVRIFECAVPRPREEEER